MTDLKSNQRVKRLRQNRQQDGLIETNVWIPETVRTAIAKAVEKGEYPSRRVAITRTLEDKFLVKTAT
jgi:hypothetical protein